MPRGGGRSGSSPEWGLCPQTFLPTLGAVSWGPEKSLPGSLDSGAAPGPGFHHGLPGRSACGARCAAAPSPHLLRPCPPSGCRELPVQRGEASVMTSAGVGPLPPGTLEGETPGCVLRPVQTESLEQRRVGGAFHDRDDIEKMCHPIKTCKLNFTAC